MDCGTSLFQFIEQRHEFVKPGGLLEVSVGAEFIGGNYVVRQTRAAKQNHGDDVALGMAAKPLDEFESTDARHFEIADDDLWEWGTSSDQRTGRSLAGIRRLRDRRART